MTEPIEQPSMWWSPTYGLIVRLDRGLGEGRLVVSEYRSGTYAGRATGSEELPTDAVRLLPLASAQPGTVTPTSFGATAVRQLRAEMPDLTKASETAEEYGYRQAFERICDWLEYEFKPVPAEAGGSTASRYFVDGDGYGDPTIWQVTGPGEDDCKAIVRKCTLDGEDPILWPRLVKALTGQDAPDTAGGAR